MAHSSPPFHGPESKRPRGILKNSSSYHRSPPHNPVAVSPDPVENISPLASPHAAMERHLSDRDIVFQNTLQNAGRRRSSSNQSRAGTASRRHSHHESDNSNPDGSPRLKWDEANLYLTEQERTPKMKIDEPKTPFAKGYDPTEDDAELRMLDVEDLKVDELDQRPPKRRVTPDVNIPDLDLGEPEEAALDLRRKESHSPKQVVVKADYVGENPHVPGDEPETPEEEEKHKKFEELRKKHYEMKNVAGLLGHPELIEDEDEDGDVELNDAKAESTNGVSDTPAIPGAFINGDKSA